jgi:hypothetical protein
MSTAAVRTAAESEVATILTGYHEVPFQAFMESNDARTLDNGYAIWFGNASQSFAIHQAITLEMPIRVSVSKRVYIRNNDDKITDTLNTLYGFTDDIIRKFVTDRLDISNTVANAVLTEMSEPQLIGQGRDIVALNLTFQVRYLL